MVKGRNKTRYHQKKKPIWKIKLLCITIRIASGIKLYLAKIKPSWDKSQMFPFIYIYIYIYIYNIYIYIYYI